MLRDTLAFLVSPGRVGFVRPLAAKYIHTSTCRNLVVGLAL